MKRFRTVLSLSIACIFALTTLPRAMSETTAAANAKVLLDEAKKNQAERKRAAMQKELDRLAEDAKKGKQEMEEQEKSISKVGSAVDESKGILDQLAGRKKHIAQDMELMILRIEAERLKTEGLALLNNAHGKAVEALTKRNEEIDLRTALVTAEIQKMSSSEIAQDYDSKKGKGDSSPTTTELRKNLSKAEGRSSFANSRAREAMDAASLKLQQAEAAAAKVEKKQAEFTTENAPHAPIVIEAVKPKTKRGH